MITSFMTVILQNSKERIVFSLNIVLVGYPCGGKKVILTLTCHHKQKRGGSAVIDLNVKVKEWHFRKT